MGEFGAGVESYVARGESMTAASAQRRRIVRTRKFDSIAVHGMYDMEAALANQGSIIEPAYLSSAQHFENSDHMEAALAYLMPSWTYSRIANPTQGYLEQTLALLESYGFAGEASAVATSSGMSAIFMATNPLLAEPTPRMNLVASAKCYGGTFMLFAERYGRERGIDVRWIRDSLDLEEWAARIDTDTRFVYGEMPANPTLSVFDIEAVAGLAHDARHPADRRLDGGHTGADATAYPWRRCRDPLADQVHDQQWPRRRGRDRGPQGHPDPGRAGRDGGGLCHLRQAPALS